MWAVQIGLLPGRVVMCCVRSVGEGSLHGRDTLGVVWGGKDAGEEWCLLGKVWKVLSEKLEWGGSGIGFGKH